MDKNRILDLAGVNQVNENEQLLENPFSGIANMVRKAAGYADRFLPRGQADSTSNRANLDNARALGVRNRYNREQPLPSRNAATQTPGPGVYRPKDAGVRADISSYVNSWAKTLQNSPMNERIALIKEIVNYLHDRKNDPHVQNVIGGVEQIIKRNSDSRMRSFSSAAIQKLRSGEMFEAWLFNIINTLLIESDVTWEQIGLSYIVEGEQVQVKML